MTKRSLIGWASCRHFNEVNHNGKSKISSSDFGLTIPDSRKIIMAGMSVCLAVFKTHWLESGVIFFFGGFLILHIKLTQRPNFDKSMRYER